MNLNRDEINCFGAKKGPEQGHVARREPRVRTRKRDNRYFGRNISHLLIFLKRRKRKIKRKAKVFSVI